MGTLIVLAVVGWIIYILFFSPRNQPSLPHHDELRNPPRPYLRPGVQTTCHLAGAPHYIGGKTPENFKIFAPGQELDAVREPDNIHDRLAILLTLYGRKVGHVPRAHNQEHALHMDSGGYISVRIVSVNPKDPWHGVAIMVRNY